MEWHYQMTLLSFKIRSTASKHNVISVLCPRLFIKLVLDSVFRLNEDDKRTFPIYTYLIMIIILTTGPLQS